MTPMYPEAASESDVDTLASSVVLEPLTFCNACLGSTDPEYQRYNLYVTGVVLAVVGFVGIGGNILVMATYLSGNLRRRPSSIYLAGLALSDCLLICCALFLFVLEAWRHHGVQWAAWLYTTGAPWVFPVSALFQTSSVYLCVAAAVDCFITVVLPKHVGCKYSTTLRAKITVVVIFLLSVLYNIPHAFEIESVPCMGADGQLGRQICPTEFRQHSLYYVIYYTYLYTTFMAVGPLVVLVMINTCVVYTVAKHGGNGSAEDSDDTLSLVLVVFFFIFCNFTALLVNFLEMLFRDKAATLVYLVDLSNLLVVVNGTINFFCYLLFGSSFRAQLKVVLFSSSSSSEHNRASSAYHLKQDSKKLIVSWTNNGGEAATTMDDEAQKESQPELDETGSNRMMATLI